MDGEDYYSIRKARVSHVAPVEVGAGINTSTIGIKSLVGLSAMAALSVLG